MNLVGPAGASPPSANAGPGTLQAGVSISVTVLEDLGQGLWKVAAGGRLLTARAETLLQPGAKFLARVEIGPDGESLLLRIQEAPQGAAGPRGFDSLVRDAGLPLDAAGRWAASALLSMGQKALAPVLARVRRAVLSEGDLDPKSMEARAGLAASLEAKGLAASPEAVDALFGLSQGSVGEDGGGSGGEAQSRNPGQPTGEVERQIPSEEVEAALSAYLRDLCLSVSQDSEASLGRGKEGLLGLFNHARGTLGGSILIPFAFSLDAIAFSGNFRILLPYMAGGPGRIEARFTATDREGLKESAWAFDLGLGGKAPQLSLLEARGEAPRDGLARELGRELEGLGCSLSLPQAGGLSHDVQA